MKRSFLLALLVAGLTTGLRGGERPGVVLDPGFDPPNLLLPWGYSALQGALVLPDSHVLIWGGFADIHEFDRTGVALLDSTGKLVTNFDPRVTFSGFQGILAAARQADGRILIAGPLTSVAGEPRNGLARLNSDGSLDSSFDAHLDSIEWVDALQPVASGKVLLHGGFRTLNEGVQVQVARLGADGSLEKLIAPWTDVPTTGVSFEANGSILLFDVVEARETGIVARIVRLDGDGQLLKDVTTAELPGSRVVKILEQPDGKWIVLSERSDGGRYYYSVQSFLRRLNADGTIDPSFNLGAGIEPYVESGYMHYLSEGRVNDLFLQKDGRIWIAGRFVGYDGTSRTNLARLKSDGTLDATFNAGEGPDGAIDHLWPVNDSTLLLQGQFANISGFPRPGLARIFTNGRSLPAMRFAAQHLLASEAQGFVELDLWRYGDARESIETSYGIVSGSGIDRREIHGTVRFEPLETEKTISIPIENNFLPESDRRISISLEPPAETTGKTLKVNPLEISILDDDRPGSLDFHFTADVEVIPLSQRVETAAVQPDGRILIAGSFKTVSGLSRPGLARLNEDGTLDDGFAPVLDTNMAGTRLLLQPDGKILFAYIRYDDYTTGILRFNPDGQLDSSFSAIERDNNSANLALQSDGRIIVWRYGYSPDGLTPLQFHRLNSDGSVDVAFTPKIQGENLSAVLPLSDGRILVAGVLQAVDGVPERRLARLISDGSLDRTFSPPAIEGVVQDMAVSRDGRVVLAGNALLTGYGGVARLNENGSLDESFHPPFANDASVPRIALEKSGRIIVNGYLPMVDHVDAGPYLRLNSDGSVDSNFQAVAGLYIYQVDAQLLAIQKDGKILLNSSLAFNAGGLTRGMMRLNGDPPLRMESSLLIGGGTARTTVRTLPGREYILEESPDLTKWSTVHNWHSAGYFESFDDTEASRSPRKFYRAAEVSR